jgi:hypothetical protein
MKWSEACRAAIQNLTLKRAVLPVMGVAAAVVCFCFSAAITNSIQAEKNLPCELSVAPANAGKLTDSIAQQISQIPNVKAVTLVLSIPVEISTGKYHSKMTLTAIDPAYENTAFEKGRIFQATSAMPYLVLNETACKAFSNETSSDTTTDKASLKAAQATQSALPAIDWLNATFLIQAGKDSRKITAKVCGITAKNQAEKNRTTGKERKSGKEQSPTALISLSAGKEFLRQSRQPIEYSGIKVRVLNSGCASAVSTEMERLGVTATAADTANTTQQTKWDAEEKEKSYLIVIGLICLLFSISFILALHKIALLEQADYFPFLKQPSIQKIDVVRIFRLQVATFLMLGILIWFAVAVALPYLLPQGVQY